MIICVTIHFNFSGINAQVYNRWVIMAGMRLTFYETTRHTGWMEMSRMQGQVRGAKIRGVFNFPFKNHFQIKEIDPHIPDKLLFNQGAKTTQWEKMDGVLIGYSESNCPPNSGLWASARGMPFSGNPHHAIWAPLLGSPHTTHTLENQT